MGLRVLVAGTLGAVVALSAGAAFAAPLSEQKWRKQGNAICKQTNAELEEVGNEVFADLGPNEEPSAEQAAAYVEQFVPVIEEAVSSIDALKEPAALKKDVKKFKAEVAKTLDALEADPTIAIGGGSGKDPFANVSKIAKKLGLKQCS